MQRTHGGGGEGRGAKENRKGLPQDETAEGYRHLLPWGRSGNHGGLLDGGIVVFLRQICARRFSVILLSEQAEYTKTHEKASKEAFKCQNGAYLVHYSIKA